MSERVSARVRARVRGSIKKRLGVGGVEGKGKGEAARRLKNRHFDSMRLIPDSEAAEGKGVRAIMRWRAKRRLKKNLRK